MERAGEVREDYCRYLMKKEKEREDNISSSFFFVPRAPLYLTHLGSPNLNFISIFKTIYMGKTRYL